MTANRTATFFSRLSGSDEPDADLVRRYATTRDAAAFESILRRHGPLVFAICRRTLGCSHDAEDAFQAAFLVLARKAGRIREPQLLSSWLYGVAVRVANKAKGRAARRREEPRAELPEQTTMETPRDFEFGPVFDSELAALPEWYRQAILFCDVQELSRAEAAARLGISEGTLSSRLATGRKRLAARLARRGVALSVPAMASVASAAVPEKLIQHTLETAVLGIAGGPVSKSILELTREGMTMFRKAMMFGCGAVTISALGFGLAGDPAKPTPERPDTNDPASKAVAKAQPVVATVGAPRQRGIVDVPTRYQTIRWSPDGRLILLTGIDPRSQGNQFGTVSTFVTTVRSDEGRPRTGGDTNSMTSIKGNVIGLHPKDVSSLLVHLEETGGINVQNKLQVVKGTNKEVLSEVELSDSAALEPILSSDGRTVLFTMYDEAARSTELREIDFTTGKLERLAFRTEGNLLAVGADGSLAVTTRYISQIGKAEAAGGPPVEIEVQNLFDLTVWNTRENRKLWTWKPVERVPVYDVLAVISHDSKTLSIAKSDGVTVHDAVSGREIRKYGATANRLVSEAFLSHDGRLTAIVERAAKVAAAGGDAGGGLTGGGGTAPPGPAPMPWTNYVTVLDNVTGKPIRKWETQLALTLAFAPDRPTLAILERPSNAPGGPMGMAIVGPMGGAPAGMMMGGGGSSGTGRLGLWDFTPTK